jgi:hypothetical protein
MATEPAVRLRPCFPLTTVDGETMTTKEKPISVVNSLSDAATLDDVIDRLDLLRKIELGIAQAVAGP